MSVTFTPQAFVAKWRDTTLKERAAAQEHFIDLCRLVGHPTPAEDDPSGTRFTFEAGADKLGGGQGWADVWKRGNFAWEYKGKHANLDKAYQQLQQYRESLQNPPLLVVCDIDTIVVHTNFTNTVKRIVEIGMDDLLTGDGTRNLRAIFYEPELFRAPQTAEQVTREAAADFARLADHLRKWGHEPERIAHFLIRLLFTLFAEDIELLPKGLFTRLIDNGRSNPHAFNHQLRQLFGAMAHGDYFGEHSVLHFNGGLFDDNSIIELDRDGLIILHKVASLDWSSIEPSILGTLFERSLDPGKRSQLGAHYTSREDILLLVEPVLMAPLRREWEKVKAQVPDLIKRRDAVTPGGKAHADRIQDIRNHFAGFAARIAATRVLDPACGSGNFLYVSLRQLLDLEKEVSQYASTVGVPGLFPQSSPAQLYGIELNEYAHELAQATVWIGYIQWLHENGYGVPSEPILKRLDNIKQMDAILAFDDEGKPYEPEWPEADVIVGNPPFLGDKKMRRELGDSYVDNLRLLYRMLTGQTDLVCYWFEKARKQISLKESKRAGLLATNSIRDGSNRRVLERIAESGTIFMAWSDRDWVLDGAAVNVSLIGFDNGSETTITLDGLPVEVIHPNLTALTNTTRARVLPENMGICFLGMMKGGPFDIDGQAARVMLNATGNPNGRPNSDVVKQRLGGQDITGRKRDAWIVDFGVDTPIEEASQYELPFEHVRTHVKPLRDFNRRDSMRTRWWIHGESRPGLRQAIRDLSRCIVTPEVSKHRIFAWMSTAIVPDHKLHVFARDDDYFFGVLHSKYHEKWSLQVGSTLEDRPSYSSSRTFGTFPFPWPPGTEPVNDPLVIVITQAAKELNEKREAWLNPPGMSEAELKKRTLTNLYNQRPTWLDLAHQKLDAAVAAAYGWPADLTDDEILERLLALNLERAR